MKLGDFGLSRFLSEHNFRSLLRVQNFLSLLMKFLKACGSVCYSAPDQLNQPSPYEPSCDIYSLAIVLWEMVTRVVVGEYRRPYGEYQRIIFLHSHLLKF